MAIKVKTSGKILIIVLIIGGLFLGKIFWWDKTDKGKKQKKDADITICVNTWGGFAGGQYFNNGFEASEESRFYKDYKIKVKFVVMDNFADSRNALKSGDVDVLYCTADALPTEMDQNSEMQKSEVKCFYQIDWSRGGDLIVVNKGVNNVKDLKGKTIAVAEMTASHTFLINTLKTAGLTMKDVTLKKVQDGIDAAKLFKTGTVDAAVIWSPDDGDCLKQVNGSKILTSTKTAMYIIPDALIAKKSFIDTHKKELGYLVEGWMKGSSELNASEEKQKAAAKILAKGYNIDENFAFIAINNARLCTYGDNINFFGLNSKFQGVTGEEVYNKMSVAYADLGYVKDPVPWRTLSDPSIIESLKPMKGTGDAAESNLVFEVPDNETKTKDAISDKQVTIEFETNSYLLSNIDKATIDKEFVDIAKSFANAYIRIEGNTDNVGNAQSNLKLSKLRAQAVADYLQNEYKFDKNRFIVIGNGSTKSVAENNTEAGRQKNRRTDFKLVSVK